MVKTIIPAPPSVTREEDTAADVYYGTKDALITAGLARADQFPPEGTQGKSYYSGVYSKRRGVIDENYLRVEFWRATNSWRVRVGVPQAVARERRIAAEKAMRARWAAEEEEKHAGKRKQEAESALHELEDLPRTADDFRRKEAISMRRWIQVKLEPIKTRYEQHGFEFADDTLEAVLMAADAVVEAILAADVKFDQAKQQRVIAKLQASAVAGEPSVSQKVAKLVRPNPGILAGESL